MAPARPTSSSASDHELGYGWFDESSYWDPADYASAADPGGDSESLPDPRGLAATDESQEAMGASPAAPLQLNPRGGSEHVPCAPNSRCGGSRPTATDCSNSPCYPRRIVEFCCGPNSRIGNRAPPGCEVIRLPAEDDLTTQAGLDKALAAVSVPGLPCLLFGALPCTGGSPWQRLNWRKGGTATRAKIR